MAEYYPLLAKAVANLKSSTPEMRRAIYDRARNAMMGQLRKADPPIADEDVRREEEALDAAIARIESDLAARALGVADAVPPPPVAPPAPPPAAIDVAPTIADPTIKAEETPRGLPNEAIAPPPVARPPAPPPLSSAPAPEDTAYRVDDIDSMAEDAPEVTGPAIDSPSRGDPVEGSRVEVARPAAPRAQPPRTGRGLYSILVGAGALALIAIAALAFIRREKPEDFAPPKPPATAEAPEAPAGKIIGRVGGGDAPPASQTAGATPVPTGGAQTEAAAPPPPPPAAAPRAALLVEAPDEPSKVKTYVGTVVWTLTPGTDGAPSVLTANCDIPEAHFKAQMTIAKNLDPKFAATHRINIRFTPTAADGPAPGVKQIAPPEMRDESKPVGDPLAGVPATIADNIFFVMLAKADVVTQRNLDSLRDHGWLDIPILLTNGKVGKITLEKGPLGDELFRQALDAWAK